MLLISLKKNTAYKSESNPSIVLTAGKASAGLQCPALGIALQERSGLVKTVQRTAVKTITSQTNTFREPRLEELLLCTLKER